MTIYSTVSSSWHKRKHQSPTLTALCKGDPPLTVGFLRKHLVLSKAFSVAGIIMIEKMNYEGSYILLRPNRAPTLRTAWCLRVNVFLLQYSLKVIYHMFHEYLLSVLVTVWTNLLAVQIMIQVLNDLNIHKSNTTDQSSENREIEA